MSSFQQKIKGHADKQGSMFPAQGKKQSLEFAPITETQMLYLLDRFK